MTKIQQIQTVLGVEADGVFGPISRRALDSEIRRGHEVIPPDFIPPASGTVHPFVAVASGWMGRPETSRNRFEGDAKLWADTSYPDGWQNREPYCAAFVCHVIAEAKRVGAAFLLIPSSPSVSELRRWARARSLVVTSPQPGDIFTLLPSGTSHTGIVERAQGDLVHTLEGNTDGAGSREGDGFWRKVRRISSCDFFRIPVS